MVRLHLSAKITDWSDVQFLNALIPIVVILWGSSIPCNEKQFSNACSSIVSIFPKILICPNLEQLRNADAPTFVVLIGIVIFDNGQLKNDESPIETIFSGRIMLFRL